MYYNYHNLMVKIYKFTHDYVIKIYCQVLAREMIQ